MVDIILPFLAAAGSMFLLAAVAFTGTIRREQAITRRVNAWAAAEYDMATNPALIAAQFDRIVALNFPDHDTQ